MYKAISKVRRQMLKKNFDAILVSSVPNITYLAGFSSFSKDEREAYLLITQNQNYILTDGRYSEAVKSKIKNFKLIEISSKLTFEKALKDLAKKHSPRGEAGKIKQVGFEHHDITVAEHKKFSSVFKTIKHFDIDNFRAIKSNQEILAIEKACKLGDETFKYILKKIKLGVSEKELAFEIEFFIKKAGGDISFPPIVAFGKNSAIPHHKPTENTKLRTQNIVLLDFGVKLNDYCSDMTRTVFFGSANAEYKKIYRTVLAAQKRAIEFLSSTFHSLPLHEKQIKASQVDKVARTYILEKGFPTIPHSLGHGVGLEVHESPRLSPKSKDRLKPGGVFTIEPGIYIPGFGGVRIEDVVVIENSGLPRRPLRREASKVGPRLLTKSTKEIIEI